MVRSGLRPAVRVAPGVRISPAERICLVVRIAQVARIARAARIARVGHIVPRVRIALLVVVRISRAAATAVCRGRRKVVFPRERGRGQPSGACALLAIGRCEIRIKRKH